MAATVAIVVSELMFQSRIVDAARRLGVATRVAESDAATTEVVDGADIVIVDLQAHGVDVVAAIRAARDAGARVLAFGRHTDARAMRAARQAGADAVVPRSQLAEELPQLIEALLSGTAGGRTGR